MALPSKKRAKDGSCRGRQPGSKGKLKLESQKAQIQHFLDIGLSKRKAAKNLQVGYNTLDRFIQRHSMVPDSSRGALDDDSSKQ